MVRITEATFQDGVFKPDEPLPIADSTRVRLVVEPIDSQDAARREASWAALQRLWRTSTLNSKGDRLTREQLHDRR